MEFKDRRVLITGAAGLSGRWFAEAFAAEGARLCLSDNRAEALAETVRDLKLDPARTLTHATELMSEASILELAGVVGREWGAPDILLNNAGIYPGKLLLETTTEEYDTILGVNVRAVFILTREMLANGLCRDLSYSAADREEFTRRANEAAILLRAAGVSVAIEPPPPIDDGLDPGL